MSKPKPVLSGGVPSVPEFRPVSVNVFSKRAARFQDLARGHAMGDYLHFASALAHAQAEQFGSLKDVAVPEPARLEHCRVHGLPPLSVDSPRHDAWRLCLYRLLEALDVGALPARAQGVVETLRRADPEDLERDAASVLAGVYSDVDPGCVPFIGAALQLYFTRLAFELGDHGTSPEVDFRQCPVCGSPPIVSIVRIGGAEQGLRYLVCSVCASEWHLVRVKCSACAATKNISYLYVDGADDALRAECCDDCKTYLKILYLEKNQDMEPLADDLASLALDLLVDEQGYRRLAPNLLFAPGIDY